MLGTVRGMRDNLDQAICDRPLQLDAEPGIGNQQQVTAAGFLAIWVR